MMLSATLDIKLHHQRGTRSVSGLLGGKQASGKKSAKQSSAPSLVARCGEEAGAVETRGQSVSRSKSDAASRKSKVSSTFYVGHHCGGNSDSEVANCMKTFTAQYSIYFGFNVL